MGLMTILRRALSSLRPMPEADGSFLLGQDRSVFVLVGRESNRTFIGHTAYGRGHTPPGGHKPITIVEGDCVEIPAALNGYK